MGKPRSEATCSEPECARRADAKGLCKQHYMRQYNPRYYDMNRREILAHNRVHRRSKQ